VINSKFYSQISKCPNCKGWGNLNSDASQKGEICDKCNGKGVFLAWTDNIFFFGAPTFVDYKSRQKIMIFRIISLVIGLTIALAILFILNQIFNFLFKF